VGPGLIGQRQRLTFTLLADGEDVRLSCKSSIADVKLLKEGMFRLGINWDYNQLNNRLAALGAYGMIAGSFALARYVLVAYVMITVLCVGPLLLLTSKVIRAGITQRRESRV
jgi:hypothetical protein